MRKVILIFLLSFFIFNFYRLIFAEESSATVFVYHRFGENKYPSTNIKMDQFESHINEIMDNNYNVLSIPEIVDHLINKKKLPPKTIGITIDDAFKSVYKKAWPLLKTSGLPFTIFVATSPVNSMSKNYMNWSDIKLLADSGVTIGHHTVTHDHLAEETEEKWENEIESANRSFRDNLGYVPDIFSYPYGEYSMNLKKFIKEKNFKAAFGQQSGVIFKEIDIFELPRFSLNEKYGTISRFKFAANALPIPVKEITPRNLVIKNVNPPLMGFTLINEIEGNIKCYPSHNINANVTKLSNTRLEVRFDKKFPKGRTRVNCTTNYNKKWRWFGLQFFNGQN